MERERATHSIALQTLARDLEGEATRDLEIKKETRLHRIVKKNQRAREMAYRIAETEYLEEKPLRPEKEKDVRNRKPKFHN